MRHQEVHRKIFAVEILVDFVSYCLRHHITVDVHVILQKHKNTFNYTNVKNTSKHNIHSIIHVTYYHIKE